MTPKHALNVYCRRRSTCSIMLARVSLSVAERKRYALRKCRDRRAASFFISFYSCAGVVLSTDTMGEDRIVQAIGTAFRSPSRLARHRLQKHYGSSFRLKRTASDAASVVSTANYSVSSVRSRRSPSIIKTTKDRATFQALQTSTVIRSKKVHKKKEAPRSSSSMRKAVYDKIDNVRKFFDTFYKKVTSVKDSALSIPSILQCSNMACD